MGERPIFSTKAHVFQIDPETRKKWISSSNQAVVVSYYHDPNRKSYRIIAIDKSKALINSTITVNMTFTKTSPKFGQWSDHRANTVYGLGFANETDLVQFADKFKEAKEALKVIIAERQKAAHPVEKAVTSPTSISNTNSSNNQDSGVVDQEHDTEKMVEGATVGKTNEAPVAKDDAKSEDEQQHSAGKKSVTSSLAEEKSHPSPSTGKKSHPGISQGMSLEAQVQQLKFENDQLKSALGTSSANAKKWEAELHTLKNNNARLTTALQESKNNVSKWKQQLNSYQEESTGLKKKVQEMESNQQSLNSKSSDDIEKLSKENTDMKQELSLLQTQLAERTEECEVLGNKVNEYKALEEMYSIASADLKNANEDRDNLKQQIGQLQDQLRLSSAASSSHLQEVGEKHAELGRRLQSLLQLHTDITGMFTS